MRYMYTGPVSVYSRPGLRPLTLVPGQVYDLGETEPRIKTLVARGYLRVGVVKPPPAPVAKPSSTAVNKTHGPVNADRAAVNADRAAVNTSEPNTKSTKGRKDNA